MNNVSKNRRCLLFLPANDMHKAQKASELMVDSIVLDLEDAIPVSEKDNARQALQGILQHLVFEPECLIRINSVQSSWWQEDIKAAASFSPSGFVIPKVESAKDVIEVSNLLAEVEKEQGFNENKFVLFGLIESALGILNIREIAAAAKDHPRFQALIFGAEDYAASVGVSRSDIGTEVLFARSAVVCAAGAYHLQAIDTVFLDYHAKDALIEECLRVKNLGFTGKLAIHPSQISPIQATFSPTEAEIDEARSLIDAFDTHQQEGRGVFAWKGKMVDMPLVIQARRILDSFVF